MIPGYSILPALAAAAWGKLHRRRVILMMDSTAQDHRRTAWKETGKKLLVRSLFDRVMVAGKRSAAYAGRLGWTREKIGLRYDVVDNRFFQHTASELRNKANRAAFGLPQNYFLFVGRFAEEKNVSTLIKAFHVYRERGGTWDLVLVGAGPVESDLRTQARRLTAGDHIYFAGVRKGAELVACYAFAGCLILPSVREPWGLVINEAMACGIPVIASQSCGCVDDLVEHEGNGLQFDPGEHGELAECMLRIAAMPDDERACLSHRASERVSHYSLENWASEVETLAAN